MRERGYKAVVELFRGFNLQRLSVVNSVIPVISAISGKRRTGMHQEASVSGVRELKYPSLVC